MGHQKQSLCVCVCVSVCLCVCVCVVGQAQECFAKGAGDTVVGCSWTSWGVDRFLRCPGKM